MLVYPLSSEETQCYSMLFVPLVTRPKVTLTDDTSGGLGFLREEH